MLEGHMALGQESSILEKAKQAPELWEVLKITNEYFHIWKTIGISLRVWLTEVLWENDLNTELFLLQEDSNTGFSNLYPVTINQQEDSFAIELWARKWAKWHRVIWSWAIFEDQEIVFLTELDWSTIRPDLWEKEFHDDL